MMSKDSPNQIRQLLHSFLPSVIAIIGFFILCGVTLIIRGQNPWKFYELILISGFSSIDDIGSILFNSTPLIFTGLAVAIGYKAGLFNIGCEGQLYVGGFAATWIGLNIDLPPFILIPFCIIAAMSFGGIWGAIPGILKARYGAHEVINTIMMNFIAFAIMSYLVTSIFQEPGQMEPQTAEIHDAARLPKLAGLIPILPQSNLLNTSFLISCVVVLFLYFLLKYTRWGYELRLVGNSPEVASYGGINPGTVTIWVMTLSGAIAGLAGVADVLGYHYRFVLSFSPGWGFTGIAVALMGRNHPFGVLAAAILFGFLSKVALDVELLLDIPHGLFIAGQGLLILGLVCMEGYIRIKNQ
ncbi:ABC transporter permease [Candidatus Poribacteria bacterium]|nr:ABC transporter permease [Candidatus Poribacteria bacterium]